MYFEGSKTDIFMGLVSQQQRWARRFRTWPLCWNRLKTLPGQANQDRAQSNWSMETMRVQIDPPATPACPLIRQQTSQGHCGSGLAHSAFLIATAQTYTQILPGAWYPDALRPSHPTNGQNQKMNATTFRRQLNTLTLQEGVPKTCYALQQRNLFDSSPWSTLEKGLVPAIQIARKINSNHTAVSAPSGGSGVVGNRANSP